MLQRRLAAAWYGVRRAAATAPEWGSVHDI